MGRPPRLPSRLLRGPFTVDEARRAGLDRWHLEGDSWKRVGPSMYVWKGLTDDPIKLLEAALRRLPAEAAFSGATAAWLHGIDVSPCQPIEATVPESAGISARAGIVLRRASLGKHEVVRVKGMPATAARRTIGELCSRLETVEAVVVADQALHKGLVDLDGLKSWAASRARNRGIQNLRQVIGHAERAAESPMESRLRMLLVLNGLPRPKAQVSIHDRWGRFIGRPDLFYDSARLGIEYDGAVHRETLAEDKRRQNRLLSAGIQLLRFTAVDLARDPDGVVAQVRAILSKTPTDAKPAAAGARGLFERVLSASAGARG